MQAPREDGVMPIYISDSKYVMKANLSIECIKRFQEYGREKQTCVSVTTDFATHRYPRIDHQRNRTKV
jgi:hypothetical protein